LAFERWQEFADEELVVGALLGDVAAFDVLVLRYRPAVLAAVSRQISRRELAEDICQEAFLLAFKALPQLADRRCFPAWLHAIARRQAIRHSRGEARAAHTPLDELILDHSQVLGQSGWEALERQENQAWVRQAMATLPEEFQLVLTLRYWSEMPLERVSAFLGLPLTTVKWRLHRARALMRERLLETAEEGCAAPIPPESNNSRSHHGSRDNRSRQRAAAHRAHAGEDGLHGRARFPDRQHGGRPGSGGPQLQFGDRASVEHRRDPCQPVPAVGGRR
jgi:RNA polymerase sigma-70 factor (ECF subfamily)